MDRDIAKQLRALFDAHDEVFQALRAANNGMGAANQSMGTANQAMGAAIQAHDDAIQAALSANRAALDLLTRLENGGPSPGPQ